MSTPRRFWLTGGIAVALAGAQQSPLRAEEVRGVRFSRYSVHETMERIEGLARRRGLPVFARFHALPHAPSTAVLVLGSDDGHTLVLQPGADGGVDIELPLSLSVAPTDNGGALVDFTESRWLAGHEGLPAELLERVAALPALVEAALAAELGSGA